MLGKIVKDTVTGLKGTAVEKIEYLNGCIQYKIQPKMVKDGVPVKALWYDLQQLELVKPKKKVVKRRTLRSGRELSLKTGGPPPSSTPNMNRNK